MHFKQHLCIFSSYLVSIINHKAIMANSKLSFDINLLIKILKQLNIDAVFYFDRVRFYTDSRTSIKDLETLESLNKKNKVEFIALPHHEHLTKQVELFQLNDQLLTELAKGYYAFGDYAINYVEIACDFLLRTKKQKKALKKFFDRHLVYKSERASKSKTGYYFNNHKGSLYYASKEKKKRFVVYSDKASRTHTSKHCLHLEFRIDGLGQVKQHGVYTFNSLLAFDHEAFWGNSLGLLKPNFTKLGAYARQGKKQTKAVADNRRGKNLWLGVVYLQDYLSKHFCDDAFFNVSTEKELRKLLESEFAHFAT